MNKNTFQIAPVSKSFLGQIIEFCRQVFFSLSQLVSKNITVSKVCYIINYINMFMHCFNGILREGFKKSGGKCDLFCTRGGVGRSEVTFRRWFFCYLKLFVRLKEAPKQTLCLLLTSDMLDIASNSVSKTSCAISGTSVADTRKWWQGSLKI